MKNVAMNIGQILTSGLLAALLVPAVVIAECASDRNDGCAPCGGLGDDKAVCGMCDPAKWRDMKPQTKCPIMGESVNKDLYVDAGCCRIYVCCKGCIEKVKADPATAIRKIIEAEERPECLPSCKCACCSANDDGQCGKGGGGKCVAVTGFKYINTNELAALIASGKPIVILDARTGRWDDGRRIPGARSLAPDASAEDAAKAIPAKDSLVVTYCSGPKCPASAKLAERLRSFGYTNVTEYHEGIQGWADAGKEITKTDKK